MYDVDEGTIRIDGVDIRDIPQEILRARMGVVLQENFLFTGSVWQNITYAKPNATREEVIAAAKAAGAHEFIVRLPDGYNTYVGEKGHTLSGGERQRISIARALLHNPKILILDEATASLDTETEKLIQDALLELSAGRTTIAIAHRLSTLRHATRLVVMDKGSIAEIGTHDELMEKQGIYYGLVMAQRDMTKMEV
jgi:ATP-binding cassette subfamily B protein